MPCKKTEGLATDRQDKRRTRGKRWRIGMRAAKVPYEIIGITAEAVVSRAREIL
jgi:hypothetical protein